MPRSFRPYIVGLLGAALAALLLFGTARQDQPVPSSVDDVPPLPFGAESAPSLAGALADLGRKGGRPVVRVTFPQGTDSETLQSGIVYLVTIPDDPSVATVALDEAITLNGQRGVNYFGYKYVSRDAASERAAKIRADGGEPLGFGQLFPGRFFASSGARNQDQQYGRVIGGFETRSGLIMASPLGVTLERNTMYVLVINSPGNVVFRLPRVVCGDGARGQGERCDDGNTDAGDGCSAVCSIEAGYGCTGTPSVCAPLEGREYVEIRQEAMPATAAAVAGSTVPVMRFTIAPVAGAEPVPETASVALTVRRGVISDIVSLAAFHDADGDGTYETQIGGDVVQQSDFGANFFDMRDLPVGAQGSLVRIEIRARLAAQVIVRELSMKFPDSVTFDHVQTASVSFADGTPDAMGGSVDGRCPLATRYCAVRIITEGGIATHYSITNPACGNGILGAGETCDDGNRSSGDGCSDICRTEAGYTCAGAPSACVPCGNGGIEGSESCDDGNQISGDGCSDLCSVEAGFICTGAPSECSIPPSCGDGIIGGGEMCDDGNGASDDGCSAACVVETGYACTGEPSVCTSNVVLSTTLDARLPVGINRIAIAWDQAGRKAYLFGGEGRITVNGTTYGYNPDSVAIFDAVSETLSTGHGAMPAGGLYSASAVWDPVRGKAYVFGGYSNRTSPGSDPVIMRDSILEYDPATETLGVVANLPSPRIDSTVVWDTTRNVPYIIGGTRGYAEGDPRYDGLYNDVVSEVVRFDPATRQMSVTPFPYEEIGTIKDPAVYVPEEDKVFIFGYHGRDYVYNQGYLLLSFDPAASAVTLHEDIVLPGEEGKGLYYGSHVFWDGRDRKVRLWGGTMYNAFYEPGATRHNVTYNFTFDPATLTFQRAADSTAAAYPNADAVWDAASRRAYLFGGWTVERGGPNGSEWRYSDAITRFSF